MRMIILAGLLSLAACAGNNPGIVVLQDPKTGQMAQCQADPWVHTNPFAATEACAKGYESAGWVRKSQY